MRFLLRFVIGALLLLVALPAAAAGPFNQVSQVNAGQCDHHGAPAINVTLRVVNDADSGQGGNYWAFDNHVRHIQVWAQSDGTFCALVSDQGQFDGQAGQTSPGATGVLTGAEDGAFEGGYRAMITGALKADPAWRTRGNLGTVDYQCDIAGNCPGYVNWLDQYFESGWGFSYEWWGWTYHGGRFGTWVNSVDGNSGDIVGS